MRLDHEEKRALMTALEGVRANAVYLFGSRVDDNARGGDIDILILTEEPGFETSQRVATRFFSECEERIDVIVMNPRALSAQQAAFLETIRKERIQ
ncbi:MAG: nucleotidyltransferase domain-containing protein [Gammaproteobacteria bacterium]